MAHIPKGIRASTHLASLRELSGILFENSKDGLFLADKSGQLLDTNLPLCELLGYTKTQILACALQDLFPGNDLTIRENQIKFELAQLCSVRKHDQREIQLSLKIHSLADGSLFGIVRDELKQGKETSQLTPSEICVQFAPISIFRLAKDGRITEVNQEACLSLGYSESELTQMTVFDIDPIFTRELWLSSSQHLEDSCIPILESSHRRKDGSIFPVEVTVNVFQHQAEVFLYAFVRDISKQKNAETQAYQNLQRYRILAEASFEGIAYIRQGHLIDVNEPYAGMFGYSRNQILNTPVMDLVAAEDRETFTNYIRSNSMEPHIYRGLRQNGTKFTAEIRTRTIHIDDQDIQVSAIRDITEQKRIEDDLLKLSVREKEAFRITRMGHWEFDIASGIFTFNDQFYAVYGTTAQAESGYKIAAVDYARKFIHPEDSHLVREAIQAAIQAKTSDFHHQVESRMLRADGVVRNIIVWFWLEKNERGETIKTYGVNQDITERKLAEQEIQKLNAELELRVRQRTAQLVAANKELESFAYSVSHDLRAPIRAIQSYSTALEEDCGSSLDKTGLNYLKRIQSSCQHMSYLIDDLLKLSQVTRTEMLIKDINLSHLVKEIVDDLQSSQPDRITFWQITPGLTARADGALIRIALSNLLGNSWKFSGKRRETCIEFGAQTQDNRRVFYIRDNGAGFDMKYANKLFHEFQRLHSAQDFEGTGIGLALVHKIIQRHGGQVWAESILGEGATFFFTLESHDEMLSVPGEINSRANE